VDVSPAVFKTVCGALLRRPGWVRFPSIPATRRGFDSEDDSHGVDARGCQRFSEDVRPCAGFGRRLNTSLPTDATPVRLASPR
jgi:hypothetical protein